MKTKHLELLIAVLFGFCVLAQEQEEYDFSSEQTYGESNTTKLKHHSIYAEFGGNSVLYSLNYDYTFFLWKGCKLAVGSGLEYFMIKPHDDLDNPQYKPFLFVTPAVNFLFGKKSHHLEIGMSAINLSIPGARIGYRYQPAKGGFFFRVGYTPLFTISKSYEYRFDSDFNFYLDSTKRSYNVEPFHWGGISFGYTF